MTNQKPRTLEHLIQQHNWGKQWDSEQAWRDWMNSPAGTFEILQDPWKAWLPTKFRPGPPQHRARALILDTLSRTQQPVSDSEPRP